MVALWRLFFLLEPPGFIHGEVQSLLSAVQLLTLYSEFPGKRKRLLGQLSLVNMRDKMHVGVSPLAMGPLISFLTTFHPMSKESDIWDVAMNVRNVLHAQLRRNEPYVTLPYLAKFLRFRQFHMEGELKKAKRFFQKLERFGPKVSVLSNTGVFPYNGDFGELQVRSLQFFAALSGSGRFGSSATTFRGQLRWNFTYAEPVISKERAERMCQQAKAILLQTIDGTS